MVAFDSVVTAMSGDYQSQSFGWCCRDARTQLSNTLNLVTYLEVQLLELMDENQQLKAQLETFSEVKLPSKTKERHFLPPENMEQSRKIETDIPDREENGSDSTPTSQRPFPINPALNLSLTQSSENGYQSSNAPLNGDQLDRSNHSLKADNVLCAPLKRKLSEYKLPDSKRDVKPPVPLLEGSFKCDKCPMSFPTAEFLSFHLPTHAGKRKGYHICPVCDAMFVVKTDLSKHLAIHPDIKQYICPVCSKSYTSKNNYKLHVKIHTGEGLYPCSYCAKSFHTENHLNVHLRTHTGERPYECSFCQKCFTQKSGLVNHTRLHTGEKPFMCPLCPKSFTQKSNLNFHLSKHHPPFVTSNAIPPSEPCRLTDNSSPTNDSSVSNEPYPPNTSCDPSNLPVFPRNESQVST